MDRMVTHILFDLCLFKHFSPVANFGYQSLCTILIGNRNFKFLKQALLNVFEMIFTCHSDINFTLDQIADDSRPGSVRLSFTIIFAIVAG